MEFGGVWGKWDTATSCQIGREIWPNLATLTSTEVLRVGQGWVGFWVMK